MTDSQRGHGSSSRRQPINYDADSSSTNTSANTERSSRRSSSRTGSQSNQGSSYSYDPRKEQEERRQARQERERERESRNDENRERQSRQYMEAREGSGGRGAAGDRATAKTIDTNSLNDQPGVWGRIKGFFSWIVAKLVEINKPLLKSKKRCLDLVLVPLVFIYFEIVLRLFGSTGFFDGLGYAILFAIGYGFIVNFIASFFKGLAYRIVIGVSLLLAGLVYTVESIILTSFQVYMTFESILANTGDVVGQYSDTLGSSIIGGIPRILFFMLPGILYFIFTRHHNLKRSMGYKLSIEMLVVAVVFCLLGTGFSVGLDEERYASNYEFDTATKTFGLLTSLRLDAKYELFGNDAASSFTSSSSDSDEAETVDEASDETSDDESTEEEEEIEYDLNIMDIDLDSILETSTDEDVISLTEYVASLDASSQNEYTGIFEGKNLILICAEAFSGAVINEELTPTLYRLQHNGIYFSDYYQPAWGGSTSTGEFSFLLGLVPVDGTESLMDTVGNNLYFSLGNQFQRLGYFTMAFHNGSYSYYDRQETHYNLGYDIWLGNGNGIEDITGAWVDDADTISAMLETFADEEPFCIYWMTVSGHAAYTEDSEFVEEYYDEVISVVGEDTYSDTVVYYLCYQMALEEALTELVEGLEAAGIADDTVICLTTDHYPYGLCISSTYGNDVDYLAELYGDSYSISIPWERDQSALILWSECLEDEYADLAVEVSEPTYSLDILPTLSNMFGLEYDSRLLVGRDVFSDTDALVIWNNYSWMTVEGSYNASTGEYTPNDGYEYDEEYIEYINDIVSDKITFSRLVVSTDYYGVLFGEDDVGNDGSDGNLITTEELLANAIDLYGDDEDSDSDATDDEATEDEEEEVTTTGRTGGVNATTDEDSDEEDSDTDSSSDEDSSEETSSDDEETDTDDTE